MKPNKKINESWFNYNLDLSNLSSNLNSQAGDNARDVFKRAMGNPVGNSRGASQQFVGRFVQDLTNDLSMAIQSGSVQQQPAAQPAAQRQSFNQKLATRQLPAQGTRPSAKVGSKRIAREQTTYDKLNELFESILENEVGQSISQYILAWTNTYMKNQNWSQNENVQSLARQAEQTYNTDKGKAVLTKLASYLYSTWVTGQGQGSGANSSKELASSIQNSLGKLKNLDPAMYSQLIKNINV